VENINIPSNYNVTQSTQSGGQLEYSHPECPNEWHPMLSFIPQIEQSRYQEERQNDDTERIGYQPSEKCR
jgi:hypothetical protein